MAYFPPFKDGQSHNSGRFRSDSFRTPGLGTAAVQPVMTLWNGNTNKKCTIIMCKVDCVNSAGRLVTVPPPIIRVHKVFAPPTGTNAVVLEKTTKDSSGVSHANVIVRGIASSDGVNVSPANQPLVQTFPNFNGGLITQEFGPRSLPATASVSGYEKADTTEFFEGKSIVLQPGEGLSLMIDPQGNTNSNPTSTFWVGTMEWFESDTDITYVAPTMSGLADQVQIQSLRINDDSTIKWDSNSPITLLTAGRAQNVEVQAVVTNPVNLVYLGDMPLGTGLWHTLSSSRFLAWVSSNQFSDGTGDLTLTFRSAITLATLDTVTATIFQSNV